MRIMNHHISQNKKEQADLFHKLLSLKILTIVSKESKFLRSSNGFTTPDFVKFVINLATIF